MERRLRRVTERLPGRLLRLVEIGALPSGPDDVRARKAVLVLSSALMALLACVWVVTYAVLGLWLPAAIPFAYQVATVVSIAVFARTRRYVLFRASQLVLPLALPFALQWSLGGFANSSAVSAWAITAPLGALLFVGPRQAVPWFGAFVGLLALSAVLDPTLSDHAPAVPQGVIVAFFALTITGVATTVFVLMQYFVRARERALTDLACQHRELEDEQCRSERLLLNVLPEPVAARLKDHDGVIADDFPDVTVLFADIVGFTPLAARLEASAVVQLLDAVFADWDALAATHGVEKIKTIGDAYMAAGGIPLPRPDHAEAIAALALELGPALERRAAERGLTLQVRIGIDSGPVVAGVIGRAKFSYDLWGDTVNTASRMESHAPPGTIQVSERAAARLRHGYSLRPRGTVDVKGKGPMPAYLLLGPRVQEPAIGVSPRAPRPL
jgi:class 3 adenylate cyclase